MTHETPDPNSQTPGTVDPGLPTISPEQAPQATQLSTDQLGVLIKYTEGATDRRIDPSDYRVALRHIKSAAEQTGDSEEAGGLAVTAATVGAMSRDRVAFERSGRGLVQRMEDMGIAKEHAGIFYRMQGDFMARPEPRDIGRTLRAGLKYLDGRQERNGEDTSAARIAFLASGFAATKDLGLRKTIIQELRAGQ